MGSPTAARPTSRSSGIALVTERAMPNPTPIYINAQ